MGDRYVPTEAEIAWAAGLYEGEGSVTQYKQGNSSPCVRLQMTDEDVVRNWARIVGARVSGPFTDRKRPDRKPWWHAATSNWTDTVNLITLLGPWLGQRRREQIAAVLIAQPDHWRRPQAFVPCDGPVEASASGYLKHRRRGERACPVCLASNRLYYAERKRQIQEATPNT